MMKEGSNNNTTLGTGLHSTRSTKDLKKMLAHASSSCLTDQDNSLINELPASCADFSHLLGVNQQRRMSFSNEQSRGHVIDEEEDEERQFQITFKPSLAEDSQSSVKTSLTKRDRVSSSSEADTCTNCSDSNDNIYKYSSSSSIFKGNLVRDTSTPELKMYNSFELQEKEKAAARERASSVRK